MTFEINNLSVEIEGKNILPGLNLNLEEGKVNVLMGPNGSGKSTLAMTIMGHPMYKVTSGKILYKGEDLTNMKPDERAKRGIFLSFQYPQEVSGISMSNLLRTSYNELNKDNMLSIFESRKYLSDKSKILNLDESFLNRNLNEGFSGGEKKKSEMLQLLALNPKLAILDETDSGLDIDALRLIAESINKFMSDQSGEPKTVLIITHYKRLLQYINVDKVFIMFKGEIVHESEGDNIINKLEEKGYKWLENNNYKNDTEI